MTAYLITIKKIQENQSENKLTVIWGAYGLVLGILILTMFIGFFISRASASEKAPEKVFKYYTSIKIQEGDTLWSIAEQYMGEEYESVQDYIDELKFMNRLSSDQIIEGRYLTVSYYSCEYR